MQQRIHTNSCHLVHAFTLIELLVVVSIISILAAIAVPNFLEAQVRSKLAHTRSDMSAVAAALRAYSVRYDAWPPNRPWVRDRLKRYVAAGPNGPLPKFGPADNPPGISVLSNNDKLPFLLASGWDLAPLTTPAAWLISSLPSDPFNRASSSSFDGNDHQREPLPFIYINQSAVEDSAGLFMTYVILSYGPDNDLSVENPVFGPFVAYDPTNGTTSRGDLIFTGH